MTGTSWGDWVRMEGEVDRGREYVGRQCGRLGLGPTHPAPLLPPRIQKRRRHTRDAPPRAQRAVVIRNHGRRARIMGMGSVNDRDLSFVSGGTWCWPWRRHRGNILQWRLVLGCH